MELLFLLTEFWISDEFVINSYDNWPNFWWTCTFDCLLYFQFRILHQMDLPFEWQELKSWILLPPWTRNTLPVCALDFYCWDKTWGWGTNYKPIMLLEGHTYSVLQNSLFFILDAYIVWIKCCWDVKSFIWNLNKIGSTVFKLWFFQNV